MEERLNKRFRIARDRYHLTGIPFECDLCRFRNLKERDPIHVSARDIYTLLCIRRAILDDFWSRYTSMVWGNFRILGRDYFEPAEVLSIIITVPIIVTEEVRDIVGMGCALQTMDTLRIKGKWKDQLQWYSMRRTLTWLNNAWEVGAGSSEAGGI